MKLKATMKRATSGPLTVSSPSSRLQFGKNHYRLESASPHVDGKTQIIAEINGPWEKCNYAANAIMLAHWYNHGPNMLAALEQVESELIDADLPVPECVAKAIRDVSEVNSI